MLPSPRNRRPVAAQRRVIETVADLSDGVAALKTACPVMRQVIEVAGNPPLRRSAASFEGLARIVVGQQLSIASATAIWGRTILAVQPFEPGVLLGLDATTLAKAGLSGAKVRTLRALSEALVEARFDPTGFADVPDATIHQHLVAVSGIGPWTADIFILFCLGRADGWASGDLALQFAAQHAFGLEARPTPKELQALAERWRPWRGVAARLLWAYYGAIKGARNAQPV